MQILPFDSHLSARVRTVQAPTAVLWQGSPVYNLGTVVPSPLLPVTLLDVSPEAP